jgi:DNA/RNA-binding domain of Phe-tRNA-synthetase-like protein
MSQNQGAIQVSPEVWQKLPGALLITGVATVTPGKADVQAIKLCLQSSWDALQGQAIEETSEESKRIQQWCDVLKQAGVHTKDYPPSIKAIAKRVLKGGEPFSINPIVDTYNAISMDLALPFGAYDNAELAGNLQIRISPGGESFTALGSDKNEPTVPEEIVFADDTDILTRMFLWRQSHKSKITDQTTEFTFICELLETMGPDILQRAYTLIPAKLITLLGAEVSNLQIQKA